MMCLCNSIQCQGKFIHKHDFILHSSRLAMKWKRKTILLREWDSNKCIKKTNIITIIVASSWKLSCNLMSIVLLSLLTERCFLRHSLTAFFSYWKTLKFTQEEGANKNEEILKRNVDITITALRAKAKGRHNSTSQRWNNWIGDGNWF